MRAYSLVSIMVLLAACSQAVSAGAPNPEGEAAIKSVVLDYFQGQKLKDRPRLESAFALDVAIMTGIDGEVGDEQTVASYALSDLMAPFVSGTPDAAAAENYEFLDIEITDNRMATVTFRSGDEWIDALTLLNVSGEWKIVAKSYVPQLAANDQ